MKRYSFIDQPAWLVNWNLEDVEGIQDFLEEKLHVRLDLDNEI